MRIAILQTDPQHRFVIGGIIERLNHVCFPFSDGLSMSKSLSRSTVDMLVLDWHATGLSGLDLLKSMASEAERERATVYMEGMAQMRADWSKRKGKGQRAKDKT